MTVPCINEDGPSYPHDEEDGIASDHLEIGTFESRNAATDKPELKLVGRDGNAFAILGLAMRAARGAGWTKERIAEFRAKATTGDYDNLLRVVQEHFNVY